MVARADRYRKVLELYLERPLRNRPILHDLGVGRFGYSDLKEAAPAGRWMSMYFEWD
jgi:hypothetical protein